MSNTPPICLWRFRRENLIPCYLGEGVFPSLTLACILICVGGGIFPVWNNSPITSKIVPSGKGCFCSSIVRGSPSKADID